MKINMLYKTTITTIIDTEKDMPNAKIASKGHLENIVKAELESKTNYQLEVNCEEI